MTKVLEARIHQVKMNEIFISNMGLFITDTILIVLCHS
jgi:hypothetical protein